MKSNFKILKLNNEPYDFLIIATSYENPLSSIKEIGEEIQVRKANLLFDLTLINVTDILSANMMPTQMICRHVQ